MSDSVDTLINRAVEGGVAPGLPFSSEIPSSTFVAGNLEGLREHFRLALDEFIFVNHGAFGASLAVGEQRAAEWRRYCERQPLRYFDRQLFPHLVESARRLSMHIYGDAAAIKEVALVNNATAALDAVIASIAESPQARGRQVVLLDTAYGSVKKMAARHFGDNRVVTVPMPLPLKDGAAEPLLAALDIALTNGDVALGIIDHVASNSALVLPVQEVAALFKVRGVPLLVDGAHGPGALPLADGMDGDPDFYVGNCHKWLCAPKSAGFLRAAEGPLRDALRPRITSHGASAAFPGNFMWDGCRDYAAALALPIVLDLWEAAGATQVREHNIDLARRASSLLSEKWGTTGLELAPPDSAWSQAPMRLVPLPERFGAGSNAAHALQEELYNKGIECPVKSFHGRLFVRISAHVYNNESHYQHLADMVKLLPNPA